MQTPKLNRIVLNIGTKAVDPRREGKGAIPALYALELISGQRAAITRAKKSIDKFKLRHKMPIGCKVTLRNQRMNGFPDMLINTVLPARPAPPKGAPKGARPVGTLPEKGHLLSLRSKGRDSRFSRPKLFKGISQLTFGIGEKDILEFKEMEQQYEKFASSAAYGMDIVIIIKDTQSESWSRMNMEAGQHRSEVFLSAFQVPFPR